MKNVLVLSILALAAGLPGRAAILLTLDPPDGLIQGEPGATVGWGFTLTSDPSSWISVVTTALLTESDPALGTYTDYAGLVGGPTNGVLAPGAPDWTVALGLGAYTIDAGATPGDLDAGLLDLNYETFSADPNLCSNCGTGFGDLLVPFQVEAVPEPGGVWLTGVVLPLIWVRRSKRPSQQQ